MNGKRMKNCSKYLEENLLEVERVKRVFGSRKNRTYLRIELKERLEMRWVTLLISVTVLIAVLILEIGKNENLRGKWFHINFISYEMPRDAQVCSCTCDPETQRNDVFAGLI